MKKLLLFILTAVFFQASAQLNIQPKTTLVQIDSAIRYGFLSSPPGGLFSPVHTLTNVNFRGGPEGFAYFTGNSSVTFTEGILLSTGAATNVAAPANTQNDVDHTVQGDPDLQTLSTSPITDVAVLEFDFVPKTDTIRFKYRFGSEEYPEYVCNVFNDVFGFFITGPNPAGGSYTSQNVALIPGTNIPVGVNTVNPGVPGSSSGGGQCNLANQSLAYSAYYVNNGISTTVIFDGLTTILSVVIPVKICASYHLKLAVSDASDGVFDSGVFLEARSFVGGQPSLHDTTGAAVTKDISVVCDSTPITLCAPNAVAYNWSGGFGTTQCVTVGPGSYTCVIWDPSIMCILPSFAYSVILAQPVAVIDTVGSITLCAGDSVQLVSQNQSPGNIYQWSNGDTTASTWIDYSEVGTYTLMVMDSTGTCDSVSAPVTVFSASATATIVPQGGSTTICQNGSVTLTATPPGIGYLWSTGETTASIVVTSAGSYVVTVDNGLCDAMSTPLDIIISVPDVQITNTGPLTFCQGGSVVLTATSGYPTYNWSNGVSGASQVVSGAGVYQVIATDSVGCLDSASVTVTVNSGSAFINAISDSVLCPGDSIMLTASPGTGWTWNTGEVTQSIFAKNAGGYYCEVLNLNGCSGNSDTVDIYMSVPAASIVSPVADTTICAGDNITIIAGPGAAFSWSTGASGSSISLTPASSNIYSVTVTNADGCQATTDVTVDVSFPSADITNSGDTIFCLGSSVTLNANAGSQWNWSTGQTVSSITATASGIYAVTVTDQFGCTASDQISVTVNQATAVITPAAGLTFCSGDSVLLTNASLNSSSVNWSNGATGSSIWVNDGASYYFILTDNNGCIDTSETVTNVVSIPQSSISPSGNITICQNATSILTANAGSAYAWSTGETTSSIMVTGSGNYSVSVQVTDSIGCVAVSNPVNITTSIPTASIVSPAVNVVDLCPNESVTLEASAGATYLWNNNATTSSITVNTAGNYFVDITNAFNCVATSQTITVNQLNAFADTATAGAMEFCDGGSVILMTTTPGTYAWSNGETTSSITVSSTGSYNVIVTNLNNCTAASPVFQVVSHPYPVISFTADSSSECDAFKIKFNNYSQYDNGSTFFWNFGDSTSSASPSPTHWYTDNGTYTVSLYIETPFGCSSSASNDIEVVRYPEPVARFTMEPTVENVFAGPVAFRNLSDYAIRYHWDFGDKSGSTEENPVHDYREPGYYTVTLTAINPASCENKTEKEIAIAQLFIPSAFTPNGDGKNDYFPGVLPKNIDVKDYEMTIFNRWGERVFVSDSPYKEWNGTVDGGEPAISGSYIYKLEITDQLNKVFSFNGTLTIVR